MVNATYNDATNVVTYLEDGTPAVYNVGDMAFVYTMGVFVMIMAAGVGYLYSGLLRRKNALSMLFMSLAVYSVACIQWFFWGYSLAFSDSASAFIGDLKHFGLMGVDILPSLGNTRIPALLYAFYQMQFAGVTAVIAFGAIAERGHIAPSLIAVFCWLTLVYCPIACWVWNPAGWSFVMGSLDFAGGGPVHVASGTAALAYSVFLGKRKDYGHHVYRPHSISNIILGTVMLWFGWFGFNGGSELSMNLRSVMAGFVTNIAAATGGLTWVLLDLRKEGKFSVVGLCSGIIAGLVGITPAAGYVGVPASLAIGFVTAIACNFASLLHHHLHFDDPVDVFALHGVGGYVGSVLTGLFADSRVASFNGSTEIPGGWINHNWVQLGYQFADVTAIMAYSFVMTYIILFLINLVPFLKLRTSAEAEDIGLDYYLHGETAFDDDESLRKHSSHDSAEKAPGRTTVEPATTV